jgi:hypothetical protein
MSVSLAAPVSPLSTGVIAGRGGRALRMEIRLVVAFAGLLTVAALGDLTIPPDSAMGRVFRYDDAQRNAAVGGSQLGADVADVGGTPAFPRRPPYTYDGPANLARAPERPAGYALAPRAVGQRTMPSNGYS